MTDCRALVPVDTMDTQALDIIRQLDRVKAKSAHQQAIASIKATTECVSIEGALSILEVYGCDRDTVHIEGSKWNAYDFGREKWFPDLQGRMAHETPIFWFYGGPPGREKWYEGTLQTLLDDRVMREIQSRGAEAVAKLIGLDLEGASYVLTSDASK